MRKKVCPSCGKEKGWNQFYAKERDKRGRMVRPQSYCKPCARVKRQAWSEANREHERKQRSQNRKTRRMLDPSYVEREREYYRTRARKKRREDPEWRERHNARSRKWRASLKENPERLAEHRAKVAAYQEQWLARKRQDPEWLEEQRRKAKDYYLRVTKPRYREDPEFRGLKRAYQRDRYSRDHVRQRSSKYTRPTDLDRRRSTGLPIGPFREWLLEFREQNRDPNAAADKQYAGISAQIALVLGVAEAAADRAMYRWLNENQVIPLDLADAVLTHLDSPARLYELWPELAEEAAA